ncbi:MAG: TRAP transporter small permease [Burkholderiales bacterium]
MSFGKVVDRAEEGLIALLLTVMTLISFTQVVARYVFNFSFIWALELVTYLFAFLIFLGMSYGVRVGGHIGVDALVKSLPPAKARALGVVATLLCMLYAAIVFYGGWVYVAKMYQIGIMAQDIPIPQWVPRLVLPFGFGFLFFRFGQVLYQLLTGKEAHLLGDEVEEALKLRSNDAEPPTQGGN